jgi:AraC-like DNA-binding protein
MCSGRDHAKARNARIASLRRSLLRIAHSEGDFETAIPALTVHRRDTTTAPLPCIYALGLVVTVAGGKRVAMGNQTFDCEAGDCLLASVELPLVSHVSRASRADPYLGIVLKLESRLIQKVAADMMVKRATRSTSDGVLTKSSIHDPLLGVLERLVALLDETDLITVLGPLLVQETIARVLAGEHGPNLLRLNSSGAPARQIAETMAWLKEHFAERIRIEALADRTRMSASSFRQHFKSIAGVSPLQYIKHLRLQEARQLMLNENFDATTAGLRVGYESLSQFSREYARMFGHPPARDIKRLRKDD